MATTGGVVHSRRTSYNESVLDRSSLLKLALTTTAVGGGLLAVHIANKNTTTLAPEDALPKETFLAATLDGDALRASPIYAELFGHGEGALGAERLGLGTLSKNCGFDPMDRVHRLALAAPEDNKESDFGVAAELSVTADELGKCSSEMAKAHGGEATTKQDGDFIVLESPGAGARLAYRPQNERGGTLLVSKGRWLDAMIHAATVPSARIATHEVHSELRSALTRSGKPTLIVTTVLPAALRERLRGELAGEANSGEAADAARATMAGVLGVRAAGAAFDVGSATKDAELRVELRCDDEAGCTSVRKFVERKKAELGRSFVVRLFAGSILESVAIESTGTELRARAHAPASDLARLLKQAVGRSRTNREPQAPDSPAKSAPTTPNLPGDRIFAPHGRNVDGG